MVEKRLGADQVPVAGGGGSVSFQDAIVSSKLINGQGDFLALPGGLTARLVADGTDPFKYTIGATLVTLASNVNATMTDNAHNFLWVDTLGAMGRSALPCIYAFTAPGGPATDQHWFDLGKNVMKRWDGAAWVIIDRIFIGYVRADTGALNAAYICEPLYLTPHDRYRRSTGTDGFLDVSVGTTTVDGSKNYIAIVVRGTGVLKHSAQALTQMDFGVQGIVAVLGTSGIDLNDLGGTAGSGATPGGEGGLGGAGGGGSMGSSARSKGGDHYAPWINYTPRGGGAASNVDNVPGGTGESCQIPTDGLQNPVVGCLYGGGGGGGGGGAPGGSSPGGGGIQIRAAAMRIGASAFVRANTSNGGTGIGGGSGGGATGGGGVIAVFARSFWNDGAFTATPGSGGGEGGGSGGPGGQGGLGRAFFRRW